MATGDLCENLICLVAFGIGFVVAIPLSLTGTSFGGKCLLFGEANLLTRTVSVGKEIYCDYGVYSSSANIVLAAFLVIFRWCCIVKTMQPRTLHFILFSSVISALGWINSVVCAIFIVLGFNHWCKTVTRSSLASSCQDAEKWDWSSFSPQNINGSRFYTFMTMAEIASCGAAVIWFIISVLSGRHFRNLFLDTRATELYYQDFPFQGVDGQYPVNTSVVNTSFQEQFPPGLQPVQFAETAQTNSNHLISQENPTQVKRVIYM